jgi:hypothetical protein
MRGGLVGYKAIDDRGAVALVGEVQSVKPGGPSGIEVPPLRRISYRPAS